MDILHYVMAKFEVLRTLGRDERGVTAMEYGLIAALIATVVVTAFTTLGSSITTGFTGIAGKFTAAATK